MATTLADTIWTELAGVDFELTTVDAGGVPTRSLQAGAGEPVIFLHGTSGHLEAFMRNIAPHAAHYRIHAIDMLGHGYTGKPDYPYEIPRYRDHLLAYFDAQGIEKAHIVEAFGGCFTPGRSFALSDLAVVAAWTVAGLVVAVRRFRWEP